MITQLNQYHHGCDWYQNRKDKNKTNNNKYKKREAEEGSVGIDVWSPGGTLHRRCFFFFFMYVSFVWLPLRVVNKWQKIYNVSSDLAFAYCYNPSVQTLCRRCVLFHLRLNNKTVEPDSLCITSPREQKPTTSTQLIFRCKQCSHTW